MIVVELLTGIVLRWRVLESVAFKIEFDEFEDRKKNF